MQVISVTVNTFPFYLSLAKRPLGSSMETILTVYRNKIGWNRWIILTESGLIGSRLYLILCLSGRKGHYSQQGQRGKSFLYKINYSYFLAMKTKVRYRDSKLWVIMRGRLALLRWHSGKSTRTPRVRHTVGMTASVCRNFVFFLPNFRSESCDFFLFYYNLAKSVTDPNLIVLCLHSK